MTFAGFIERLGFTPTPAQARFVATAHDGVESVADELGRSLFGAAVPAGPHAIVVMCKGARVGGTLLAVYRLLYLALTVVLSMLAPGEHAFGVIVAPDMRLGMQAFRYVLGAIDRSPTLKRAKESETATSVTLRRDDGYRVTIEVLPATRGGSALRGRTLVGAVLSEAAFFRDESGVVNDQEQYRAVVPRVVQGGQVILESTPWIEDGLLHELFTRHFGAPGRVLAVHAPTLLMRNDEETRAVVAEEQERDRKNADGEFGALFRGRTGSPAFDADLIAPAFEPCPHIGTLGTPIGILDAAGEGHDRMAFCVAAWAVTDPLIEFEGEIVREPSGAEYQILTLDRFGLPKKRPDQPKPKAILRVWGFGCFDGAARASMDWDQIVRRLAHHWMQHGVYAATGDPYMKKPLRDGLGGEGIDYRPQTWTNASKRDAAGALRSWFRDRRLVIEAGAYAADVRRELLELQEKPMPGGGMKIEARGGGHDDLAALFLNLGQLGAAPGADLRHRVELLRGPNPDEELNP